MMTKEIMSAINKINKSMMFENNNQFNDFEDFSYIKSKIKQI